MRRGYRRRSRRCGWRACWNGEGPDVLHRVQLWRIGWQAKRGDVGGHAQGAPGLVPSRAVHDDDRMDPSRDLAADLGEVEGHGAGIGGGQHEAGANGAGRADRTEEVGRSIAAVLRRGRARAALGPDTRQRALLADPGLVLPPALERLVARLRWQGGGHQGGQVGLKDACATASWPGWRGRATNRRKPRRRGT